MSDSVTLVLNGEVSLDDFADAVARFRGVVAGLTREVSETEPVTWIIDQLDVSSAVIGAHARGPVGAVNRVVREYERVGRALQIGDVIDIPPSIRTDATGLLNIINNRVESIRFETGEADAILTLASKAAMSGTPLIVQNYEPVEVFGAVEGRIQTLTSRGELKFTLYDTLHDKAVSCYIAPAYKDIMRDAWGRLALVEGIVSRDPFTGRPLSVRRVQSIHLLEEGERGGWRRARGAAPPLNDISPEDAIRALRDAE